MSAFTKDVLWALFAAACAVAAAFSGITPAAMAWSLAAGLGVALCIISYERRP